MVKIKQTHNSALEPFGQAISDYWHGNKYAELIHEFKTGSKKILPVSVFFRSKDELFPTEKAFEYCKGKVLVVGGGTGVHAIELKKQGYDITVIDICKQAVEIMKERGIKDVKQTDFFEFDEGAYNTILMLGHNIGMAEKLSGIGKLLLKCKSLLKPDGQLIVNSVKEPESEYNYSKNRYQGELEFRLIYKQNKGSWMRWLHLDFETLSFHASKSGWKTKKLKNTKEGEFLARLTP